MYFVLFRFSTYMVNNVDDNDYEQKKCVIFSEYAAVQTLSHIRVRSLLPVALIHPQFSGERMQH